VARPLSRLHLFPTEAHVEAALAEENARRDAAERGLARAPGGEARAARDDHEEPWKQGRIASFRPFAIGALTALGELSAAATPVALTLATFHSLKEVLRERPFTGTAEAPTEATAVALTATIDRAIGALRRGAKLSSGTRRSLGAWAAAVQERLDVRLRAAGWFDARGAGALLGRAIATAKVEALLDLGILGGAVLRHVHPWDADDLLWIEALHRRSLAEGGAGVEVRLPRFAADHEGDARQGEVLREPLRDRGREPVDVGLLAHAADPLADALERRWASLEDAPEIGWESVTRARVIEVRAARTKAAEARAATAAVREAIGAGVPPERVAIVVPRVSQETIGALCAALSEAKIAFAEPRGRSILACPDGRAALALLALAEGPFTRDALLEVLRAPGLHAGVWVEAADEGEAAARVARLAARLRDVPVDVDGSGRLFIEAMTTLVADSAEDAWMPRALERLVGSVRFLAEGGTLREAVRRFVSLLDRTKLGQPSARDLAAALADEKRGHGALAVSALGENASALRRLREVATEMGVAAEALDLGGTPMSTAELRAMVKALAERTGAKATGTAGRAGAVRIARPEEIAGLSFERIVVMGLVESAYGDDGEEEDLLGDNDERGEGRAHARAPRRTLALAAALASAKEAVLTYALGEEGDLDKPHAIIAGAISRGVRDVVEPASRVSPKASLLGPRSATLVALARGRPPPAELAERVRIERLRHDFFMDPRIAPDAFTGLVRLENGMAEHLSAVIGGASETSSIAVTAVERAAGCAFHGFARRVLRIARKEDLAEAGDARERGTLVHQALHTAFESARDAAEKLARGVDPAAVIREASGAGALANIGVEGPTDGTLDLENGLETSGSDAYGQANIGAKGPARFFGHLTEEEQLRDPRPSLAPHARWILGAAAPDPANDRNARIQGDPATHTSRIPERGSPEWKAIVLGAARGATERALGLHRAASPLRREAILTAVRDGLAALVRTWDEAEPMQYLRGEQRFGATAPQPWTALALVPEEGDDDARVVFLDGQIDRLDATSDLRRVRVVDYKTGRVPEGEQKKIALQLPMYAAVAARALGASESLAIYVRVTSRGMIDEHPKRAEDRLITAEKLVERSREARRAVRALWDGRVAPRPAFLSLCASCDARDVCRRPAVMPIEEQEERA